MPVSLTCVECGSGFSTKPSHAHRRRFCSQRCKGIASGRIWSAACREAAAKRVSESFIQDGALVCRIELTRGMFALIDADLAEEARKSNWVCASHGYAVNGKAGSRSYLHHLVLPVKSGYEVDHINGDKLDNRRANLRYASRIENVHNRHRANKNSRTGVRGVHQDAKGNRYIAQVTVNRKCLHIGSFPDLATAEAAVKAARQRLHSQPPSQLSCKSTSVPFETCRVTQAPSVICAACDGVDLDLYDFDVIERERAA